eukprot:3695819-Rhodomonas_salina.2
MSQDATAVHGDMLAVEGDLDFLSGKRIGALVGMQGDMIGCTRTVVQVCYGVAGTDVAAGGTRSLSAGYSEHAQLYGQVKSAICLRACYVTSGTDVAYGASPLSAYALAMRCPVLT